jgi:hypothetical protein
MLPYQGSGSPQPGGPGGSFLGSGPSPGPSLGPGPISGASSILPPDALRTPSSTKSSFLDQFATGGRLPTPDQLLEAIKSPLSQLLRREVQSTVEIEQIWKLAQIRRLHLYSRGKQHLRLAPGGAPGIVDYSPVSNSPTLGIQDNASSQYYDSVLNWLRGDVRAFNAVLGARAPNIQALAKDTADDDISTRIRKANRVAQYLRGHVDFDNFHRELINSLALKGTTFSYSRYVTNSGLYGYTQIPRYEWSTIPGGDPYFQCWGCGSETSILDAQSIADPATGLPRCKVCGRPQDDTTLLRPEPLPALTHSTPLIYPNGAVELTLMGLDRVTVPFWIRNLEESPWLRLEEEVHPGALMQAHTSLRDYLRNYLYGGYAHGPESSAQEERARYTRELFASPSGFVTTRTNLRVTHTQVWYTPWIYEILPNDPSGDFRDLLYKLFPQGMKVQYANGRPFKLSQAKLTRNWAACKPEPSETLIGDPYFEDYIQASDTVNDLVNILVETGERTVPTIVFDPNVISADRIREFANLPGEFLPALPGASSDLSKSFFRAPAAEISPALVAFIEKFISWVRDISGMTPTVWGGGGPEPTARAAELKKNQALGRLNIVWNNVREFEARTMENLAYQVATFSNGRLFSAKGEFSSMEETEIRGVDEILKGGWKYWAEEAMPMTPGQRRDWYMNLFQMAAANPIALQISGLLDPANLARWQETVGSADWRTPGLFEREGMMMILALIAAQPPLSSLGGIDPMSGLPLPPQPWTPMPIDQIILVYTPDLVIKVTREFLTSDKGREIMESDYQGGWQNLLLFLQTVLTITAPPPMPTEGSPSEDGDESSDGQDPAGGGGPANPSAPPVPAPTADLATPRGPGIAGQVMPGGSSDIGRTNLSPGGLAN